MACATRQTFCGAVLIGTPATLPLIAPFSGGLIRYTRTNQDHSHPGPAYASITTLTESRSIYQCEITYGLGEAEAEADGGVGEGHDGGDGGEPGHAVEVGYEGQHRLGRPEEQHVEVVAAGAAGSAVALAVVAVGPHDRPAAIVARVTITMQHGQEIERRERRAGNDRRTYVGYGTVPEAGRRGDGVGDCGSVHVEVLEKAAEPGALLPCARCAC
jgi:hypothetical protein